MKKIIIILVGILITISCSKDKDSITTTIDCERLSDSFISSHSGFQPDYIRTVVDSICQTLPPQPTSDDQLGHKFNSEKLANQISNQCQDIKVKLFCYACLESYPLQSSFTVTVDSMGVSVKRRFLIYVPENDFMYMD